MIEEIPDEGQFMDEVEYVCDICQKVSDVKIVVRDPYIVGDLIVCGDCLNDYANHDYDKLSAKLRRRGNHGKVG